jgi:hypothetical protein
MLPPAPAVALPVPAVTPPVPALAVDLPAVALPTPAIGLAEPAMTLVSPAATPATGALEPALGTGPTAPVPPTVFGFMALFPHALSSETASALIQYVRRKIITLPHECSHRVFS